MPPVLFDTTVYISSPGMLAQRRLDEGAVVWLSSVVLEELYAGATSRDRHALERLERDFERAGRIVIPNLADWVQTGKVLAQVAAKYDYESIGRARITNDALIAISAGRMGITVITANVRDFGKLAEFWPFRWRVEDA